MIGSKVRKESRDYLQTDDSLEIEASGMRRF